MGDLRQDDHSTSTTTLPSARRSRRLDSIDLLRGVIMVVMALDHVRDYLHHDSLVAGGPDPVNMDQTYSALFLTRWVTHFCAPTFVFLAGTGAFLYGARGRSSASLAWFLLSRGLWLIVIDMTLSRLGWAFYLWPLAKTAEGVTIWPLGGGIVFVIGAAMVLLSGLVFLPTSAVATFGVAVIAYHNMLDGKVAVDFNEPPWGGLWCILHEPHGPFGGAIAPGVMFNTGYGLLPCLGIMAAGYSFGALYQLEPGVRRKQILGLGLMLIALFVVLRYSNYYGDPKAPDPSTPGPGPWSMRDPWYFTIFSFLNCQKYPASLLYTLMTLGPSITFLALFEWVKGPVARFFVVFGRVPLFFYLLHIPLIHGIGVGIDYLRYGWSPLANDGCWSVANNKETPLDYGVSLPVAYLIWVGVVLLLYPLCWWFARIKERSRSPWLSYL
jgi:uncharacterized membrane protein